MRNWVASIGLVAAVLSAVAQADEAEVRKNMQARYPGIPVDSVTRTPMPGIYEVFANGIILYTDEKVDYVIAEGRLVDAKTRVDLTSKRLRTLQGIPFNSLPLDQSFKIVHGNGKRKIAYFADPNCGYCRRFERELHSVEDLTVYVFLYPILSQDSVDKAHNVWCSTDRAKTWNDWMQNRVVPKAAEDCDSPIDKNMRYGQEKRITGTPTLIFADGRRVPGLIPAAELKKMLDEIK